MGARGSREYNDSLLSGLNIQPDTVNPHNEEVDTGDVPWSVIEEDLDRRTRDFEMEEPKPVFALTNAAYVSRKLRESYEDDGVYMMAEVGPGGVVPVAVGDNESFFIDSDYDPEAVTTQNSPLNVVHDTGYESELDHSKMGYQTMDLASNMNVDDIERAWSDRCSLENTNMRFLVAPGLEDLYREQIDQMT